MIWNNIKEILTGKKRTITKEKEKEKKRAMLKKKNKHSTV